MKTVLFSLLILLAACNKTTVRNKDREAPVVTLNAPAPGSQVSPNVPVNITGRVSDNEYIAEIHIHITNLNTGQLMLDVHLYPAAALANFEQTFTPLVGNRYKIQIIARDRALNEGIQTVEINA